MRKVTDPEILRQLNEGRMNKVTDPEILRQLNGEEPEKPKAKEESIWEKALRYAVKDPLQGLYNMTHGMREGPEAEALANLTQSQLPKGVGEGQNLPDLLNLPQEQNSMDSLMQAVPDIAATFAVPELKLGKAEQLLEKMPGWAKYLTKGLQTAVPQGAYSAAMAPDEEKLKSAFMSAGLTGVPASIAQIIKSQSPVARTLGRLAGAGLGGAAGYEMGGDNPYLSMAMMATGAGLGGLGAGAPALTKRGTARHILEGVEGTNYKEPLEAAERLGLSYLSPAEASGNPFTGGVQGSIGKTEEGAKKLYEKGQTREGEVQKSFPELFNKIYNEKTEKPVMTALYQKAGEKLVPEESLEKFKSNEVFKHAEKIVENNPAFREGLKGVPKNSIKYLDHVKQAIDDMIEGAPKKEQKLLGETKSKLVDMMDTIAPKYKEARDIAQRDITLRNLKKAFGKTPLNASTFSRYLEKSDNYEKLKRGLVNAPQAQKQLEDMKLVFKRLINTPTAKTAEALGRSSMSKERSTAQTAMKTLNEIISGKKFDKRAVELITNPKWKDELAELKKPSSTQELAAKLITLLGKAGAAATHEKGE